MTYSRVPDTTLYLDWSRWSGVYVRQPDGALPDTLDVRTALADPGAVFLLLSEALPKGVSAQTLAADRIALALQTARDSTRVAWVAQPTTDRPYLQAQLGMQQVGDDWTLLGQVQTVVVRNLRLMFAAGAQVAADAGSLQFTPVDGPGHRLGFTDGRDPSRTTVLDAAGPATLVLLDAELPGGGIQLGAMQVSNGAAGVLDPNVRFFVPDTDPLYWTRNLALVHPLLAVPDAVDGEPLYTLTGRVDVWALDATDRTHFPMVAATPLTSWFRSAVGEAVLLGTTDDSRLTFAADPLQQPDAPYASVPPVYVTPHQTFSLQVGGVTAREATEARMDQVLVAGTEAVEFFSLVPADQQQDTVLEFTAGHAAYAPVVEGDTHDPDVAPPRFDTLTADGGTTSWARVRGAGDGACTYHAQPRANALFGASSTASPFLEFSAPDAGTVRAGDPSFPIGAIAGVPEASQVLAQSLGKQILAPTRRERIGDPHLVPRPQAVSGERPFTTTIQGFVVYDNGGAWDEVDIAQSAPDRAAPTRLRNVGGALRRALQTDQMFLAVSDFPRFLNREPDPTGKFPARPVNDQGCDLEYRLDDELQFQSLLNLNAVPEDVVAALRTIDPGVWPVVGESAFFAQCLAVLEDAGLADQLAIYGYAIANVAVDFGLFASDWTFDLSPYSWATGGTVLLFKFVPQRVDELVDNISSWTLPDAFNASPAQVQVYLQDLIERAKSLPELAELAAILTDPNWTGVLALNVMTPLSGLPDALKGLAAGIDPSQFRASYISVDVTPIKIDDTGAIEVKPSSIGALIDYQSPVPPEAGTGSSWDYTVLDLRVVIDRSVVVEFGSIVALFSRSWFGDAAILQGADYVSLDGFYQHQNGQDTYVFVNRGEERYEISGTTLAGLDTDRIQFYTLQQKANDANLVNVHTRFIIDGILQFRELEIDLFSFGETEDDDRAGLRVTAIALDMSFNITLPSQKEISFDGSAVVPDAGASRPRPGSLYQNFPLAMTGLITGGAKNRPDRTDAMPVDVAMTSDGLGDSWYALTYDLDLGGPGALVAPIGFTATVYVAWSPSDGSAQGTPRIFLGLSMPGVKGGDRSLSLEGVIKLVFGTVGLVVGQQGDQTTYILQLRRIALKILSLSIPSAATIDFYLFGDPSGKDRQTVGWYAAWDNGQTSGTLGDPAPPLRANRRNRLPRPRGGEG